MLAAPFRALLVRMLDQTGLTPSDLAKRARIPDQLANRLVTGRNGRPIVRIPHECARRLLALDGRLRIPTAR